MSEILDLSGRVALITGAGQGVGRQIALHFAAHKAGGIVVNDYFLDRAAQVVDEIKSAGGRAIGPIPYRSTHPPEHNDRTDGGERRAHPTGRHQECTPPELERPCGEPW